MIYRENYSAIRKLIADNVILFFVFVLILSGLLRAFNGQTDDNTPEVVRLIISAVFFLAALLVLCYLIRNIKKMFNIRGDWHIELNKGFIRLETPDDEVEPFEYDCKKIKKLSREAYNDDGIFYKWFIYLEDDGSELKKEFNLGPFLPEKIVDKMKEFYGVASVEVDIEGAVRAWNYGLGYKLKALLKLILATLIFLSFLIPGIFYLVKMIEGS